MKHTLEEQDLGYPHELLFLSLKRAAEVLERKYNKRTKILALLLLSIHGRKVDVRFKTDDPYLKTLLNLTGRSKVEIRRITGELHMRLVHYINQFERTQSTAALSDLKEYIKDCIFLHLIAKEIANVSIMSPELIEKCNKYIEPKNHLKDFLTALQILGQERIVRSPNDINKILSTLSLTEEESPLIETSLMLSFLMAIKFPELKSQLLLIHYKILKAISKQFEKLVEHKKLDDLALQQLFMRSLALSICGYSKSLRLPHEEEINYLEKMIGLPFIEYRVQEILDEIAIAKFRQFKLQLWLLPMMTIMFLFVHIFAEYYIPGSLNLGVISLSIPRIPIFLTISILLLVITSFKLRKIKKQLLEKLRRG